MDSSSFRDEPVTVQRWLVVSLQADPRGTEEGAHGLLKFLFFVPAFLGVVLLRKCRRCIIVCGGFVAGVSVLSGKPAEQVQEHFLCLGIARGLVKIGNRTLGQKKASLVAE